MHRASILATWWIVIAGPPAVAQPVPPPPEQIGADCARPVYASDQLVCSDPLLRALDALNAQRSAQIDAAAPGNAGHIESPADWFRRRARCAFDNRHRACLVDAYRDRLLVLSTLTGTQSIERKLVCRDAWAGRDLRVAIAATGAMRVTDAGRAFAVATPPVHGSAWKLRSPPVPMGTPSRSNCRMQRSFAAWRPSDVPAASSLNSASA